MHCVTFMRLKKYSIAEYSCKIISQVLVWANVSRAARAQALKTLPLCEKFTVTLSNVRKR